MMYSTNVNETLPLTPKEDSPAYLSQSLNDAFAKVNNAFNLAETVLTKLNNICQLTPEEIKRIELGKTSEQPPDILGRLTELNYLMSFVNDRLALAADKLGKLVY